MNRFAKTIALALSALSFMPLADAQNTPGSVAFTATVSNYTGKSDAKHYTVVWVTKTIGSTNQFVKTLWKQGPSSFTSSEWGSHCSAWNTARASSTALDGYTSATSTSYSVTNPSPPASGIGSNPVKITWNCKDASNAVVADGDYKFWVQYAEDSGQGPVTTGLAWTKRSTSFATTYPAQGTSGSPVNGNNFTNLSATWTPASIAPTITSSAPPGSGFQGVAYSHTCVAAGSAPITFSVTSGALPPSLTLSSGGVISGTPTTAGLFTGTITAANGTLPNATQNFSITITPAIVITSPTPPATGNVGTSYTHSFTATGSGTISYQIISGGLPTGLTLTSAGLISGTPQAIGTFSGAIQASNGVAPNVTQNFSITIGAALVYTPGTVSLSATLGSYGGAEHWSVAWVTKADGTFIKTLGIRGNFYDGDLAAFWDTHWNDHCPNWVTARGASQALDGFTGATAANYNPPNSPLNVTWNGRGENNALMPDGTYKLWVQYSEYDEAAPGPVTTSGLTWTKGATATSSSPVNQGTNFTAMSINWTPTPPPAPEIAVEQPPSTGLTDGGSQDFGTVVLGSSASLTFSIKNTGDADLTGLTITQDGSHPADFSISASPVAPVSGPSGSTTFIVQFAPSAAGARSAVIHLASNDSDENPFDLTLTGTGISAYDSWAATVGLGAGADPMAMPKGDGVCNLEKFAFNLDASKADVRRLVVGGGGLVGLPGTATIAGPTLRLEYLRRKASSNPGIIYTAQFGSELTGWTPATGTPTSVDDTWERVVVDDAPPVGSTQRFGRVVISQP